MLDYKKLVHRVSFELSNLCQFAKIHKKCPLHIEEVPKILPRKIVFHVLDTLASWKFKGNIGFHTYNEPGIDPRLFMFVAYARQKCPDSYIAFMSNGYYIDQNLLNEYKEIGLDEIVLSAYSNKDFKRFHSYETKLKVTVQRPVFDDRLEIYKRKKMLLNKPCLAPFNELMITREGYVGLCCLDWRREEVFGDLNQQTLEDILTTKRMISAYEHLSTGSRGFNICERCDWSR